MRSGTTQSAPGLPGETITKAYELAYFLHPDKDLALQITLEAVDSLEVSASRQEKRSYYRPRGRSSSGGTRRRNRVSMSRLHILQRLIYAESEPHERAQEERGSSLSEEIMVQRFIEYLVRITLRRNAFYVALGMTRLLHRYDNQDAIAVYDLLVQDPQRYREEPSYRKGKKLLLDEIVRRFGAFVTLERGPHGEKRLQTLSDAGRFKALVQDCLRRFTPWSTRCHVPEAFDPWAEELPAFRFAGEDPDEEHAVELNRIHASLHPDCFSWLVRALNLAPPGECLAVPVFGFSAPADPGGWDERLRPPGLDREEHQWLVGELSERRKRRRRLSSAMLSVRLDGTEAALLDLDVASRVRLPISPEVERIEVWAEEAQGPLRLATYLPRGLGSGARETAATALGDGQKITFFTAFPDQADPGETGWLEVCYHEARLWRRWARLGRRLGRRAWTWVEAFKRSQAERRKAMRFHPAWSLVLTMVIVGGIFYFEPRKDVGPTPPAPTDENLNEAGPAGRPPRATRPPPRAHSPPRQRRSVGDGRADLLLSEVEQIAVDELGDDPRARTLREALIRELDASTSFRAARTRDKADAMIQLSTGASDGHETDGRTFSLQLVNPALRVLWEGVTTSSSDAARVVQALESIKSAQR